MRERTKSLVLRTAVVTLVVLAVLGLVIWATTPTAFSSGDPNALTTWKTTFTADESLEGGPAPQPMLAPAATVTDNRLTIWRTSFKATTPQQLVPLGRTFAAGCTDRSRTIRGEIQGGNSLFPRLVWGGLSIGVCYARGNISSTNVNHWGGANSLSLWRHVGLTDMVTGAGINDAGVEYRYRRAYHTWGRGVGDFSQFATGWLAETIRGNGTCEGHKSTGARWVCP